MKYRIIDRKTALKLYENGNYIYIGYKHKKFAEFWSFRQFQRVEQGSSAKERFNSIVDYFKKRILPHTQIKYAVDERKAL